MAVGEVGWGRFFFSPVLVSPKDFMSEIAFPLFHSGPHNITLLTLGPKCEPKCCVNGGREEETQFKNYADAGEVAMQLKAGLTTKMTKPQCPLIY